MACGSVAVLATLHIVEGIGDARRARRASAQVAAAALSNGWTPAVIDLVDLPGEIGAITRVVLCGGDGLAHRVIQIAAGLAVEIAIVPVGTGNDLARSFGIKGSLAIALAASAPGTANVAPIDLIAASRDACSVVSYAATVLTAGYSGRVNATANAMRFPPGAAKYTLAALREIGRLRPRDVRLTMDLPDGGREVVEQPMTLLAIANTAYFGGGMQICPGADPSDGILDVLAVGPLGRVDLVRWLPKVFSGKHISHPSVVRRTVTAVTVETAEAMWADGELFAPAAVALTASAARHAVRLLVP